MILKRIGVMSLAKITGVVGAVMGFIIGGIYFLFILVWSLFLGAILSQFAGDAAVLGLFPIIMGLVFWVGATIGYAIGSFIMGAVYAFVYNLVAGRIGGLELDLQ
ncbi:hypothetical protein K8R43_04170 [archaeon]|nr:hypothetical protein [archaeon]